MAKFTGVICDVDGKNIPDTYPNYQVLSALGKEDAVILPKVGEYEPAKADICSLVCLRKYTVEYEAEVVKVAKAAKVAKAEAEAAATPSA